MLTTNDNPGGEEERSGAEEGRFSPPSSSPGASPLPAAAPPRSPVSHEETKTEPHTSPTTLPDSPPHTADTTATHRVRSPFSRERDTEEEAWSLPVEVETPATVVPAYSARENVPPVVPSPPSPPTFYENNEKLRDPSEHNWSPSSHPWAGSQQQQYLQQDAVQWRRAAHAPYPVAYSHLPPEGVPVPMGVPLSQGSAVPTPYPYMEHCYYQQEDLIPSQQMDGVGYEGESVGVMKHHVYVQPEQEDLNPIGGGDEDMNAIPITRIGVLSGPPPPTFWYASLWSPFADPGIFWDACVCPCILTSAAYDAMFHPHRVRNPNNRNYNCPVACGLCILMWTTYCTPLCVGNTTFCYFCVCCYPSLSVCNMILRQVIRRRFNILGHRTQWSPEELASIEGRVRLGHPPRGGCRSFTEVCGDCVCTVCCQPCVMSQHHREMIHRGAYQGKLVFSNSAVVPLMVPQQEEMI